jgi:hypothetical protein
MKFNLGEYNVQLDIPTDNFFFTLFTTYNTEYMWDFIPTVESNITNPDQLIILFGAFNNLHEYDHWITPINELKEKYKNPIVVFTGRLTSDNRTTVEPRFKYYRINLFDHVSNINCFEPTLEINAIKERNGNYKFYWASSKDLYPRRFLLANLLENNLVKEGLVNYKCVISNMSSNYLESRFNDEHVKIIAEKCKTIDDQVPLPHLDDTIEFTLTAKKFYNDSYVGIITDTFYADHGAPTGVFLSEKVYQAINHHQIFFYIGPPGSLKYLEDQGYHIFKDVFDLSYDKIEDHGERLFAATNSLIQFLKQPIEQIKDIYIKNAEHIQHNKILLQSQKKDVLIHDLLQKTLDEN